MTGAGMRETWYLPSWRGWIPDVHVEGPASADPASPYP